MTIDINQLSEDELIDLNHHIIERLKFLEASRAHGEMMKFSVGEEVTFKPPGKKPYFGILSKFNKKTVTVITHCGQRWNLSPHVLTKNKKTNLKKGKSGKVVKLHPKK